jgi:two-component system chemotaxis response regulator CheY
MARRESRAGNIKDILSFRRRYYLSETGIRIGTVAAQTYNFERISLLIADPSKYMRTLLVGLARSFGFRTIYEAADGTAALNLMRERHIDIVLMDGPMTPMDGYAFTKQVRTSPESPNPFLPIVMVSAHTEISQIKRAREAGITEFLAKPISSKTLLVRICSVIDHQRAFVRSSNFVGPDRRRHVDQAYAGPERRGVPQQSRDVQALERPDVLLPGAIPKPALVESVNLEVS